MKRFWRLRSSTRMALIAFVLALFPAFSYAGVFVSINIAPPVLPVYEQPPCPEVGYLWTPGYWAYGPDGYYWVPGAWVPAPEPGLLWTPPYWGFEGGSYIFHAGYWGPHVGYYGGVNYGFGYMGVGFAGGEWRSGHFFYNTAVMRVGPSFHNVYVNRTIVHNTTIINHDRVAYSGGPHGINHPPSAEERRFSGERHIAPTSVQSQHIQAAARNPEQRFNANHGRPATVASARPVGGEHNGSAIRGGEAGRNNGAVGHNQPGARPENGRPENNRQMTAPHTQPNQINRNAERPVTPSGRPQSEVRPRTEVRPNEPRASSPSRPAQVARHESARPEARPAQPTSRPESRPESRPAPRPESRPAPRPESHPAPRPESRPAPASHPAPHPHR